MRFRSHQSWFPKEMDLPNDYEDASALSEKHGRVVIADGVSSAIFSRTWARLLTRTAVVNPPSAMEDAAIIPWVAELQRLWREGINFKALPWNLKPKAVTTGAQATLLLIRVEPLLPADDVNAAGSSADESDSQSESADGLAEYRLQAHALGDCNLFIVRDGKMIRTFPMADSAAFASPPHVFSSIVKDAVYADKFQHLDDRCQEGDLLIVCTDAIGLWAMQEYEAGRQVEWMRYWENDEAWQTDIQHFRALPAGDPRRMRIDDCTLLLLQVVAETNEESEPEVLPDRSDDPFVLHGYKKPDGVPHQVDAAGNPSGTAETDGVVAEQCVPEGESADIVTQEATRVAKPTETDDPFAETSAEDPKGTPCGPPLIDQPASESAVSNASSTLSAPLPSAASDTAPAPPDDNHKSWFVKLFSS